jgi:hypothetical protein
LHIADRNSPLPRKLHIAFCGDLLCLLLLDNLLVQLEEESHLVGDKVNRPPLVATGLGGASQNQGLLEIVERAGLLGVLEEEVRGRLINNDVEPREKGYPASCCSIGR